MIRVRLQPEPSGFDAEVRQPGLSAIDELVGRPPRLKRRGRKRKPVASRETDIPAGAFPPLWRDALPEMRTAYDHRCAYLAMHLDFATGSPTVDHVVPKSVAWDRVYEWDNYRLCAAIVNAKKGSLGSLIDPFEVRAGWFSLNLRTFHIERCPKAPKGAASRIDATLPLLNLRDCWRQREEYVVSYRLGPGHGGIDLPYLERRAPFIAEELRRQEQLCRGDL